MTTRSKLLLTAGILLLLLSTYSFMGVIQAASLFVGARALANGNFWGAICIVTLAISIYCFLHMQNPRNEPAIFSPKLKAIFGLVVIGFGIWFVWPVVVDVIAIDKCIDGGGSFDHVLSQCDFSENHSDLSTFKRQGFRVVAFGLLIIYGLALLKPYLRNRSRVRNAL